MTAPASARPLGPLFGWCVPCYAAGDFVPSIDPVGGSVCGTHVRLLPARPATPGQLSLFDEVQVPPDLRAPYATGEQQLCWDCVAAGVPRPRRGLSERVAGDPAALCMTCWRARQDRAGRRPRPRRLSPVEAGELADLQLRLTCEVCGRFDGAGDCWRCGEQVRWLAAARAVHEQDQQSAAAERQRVDELRAEHRWALDDVDRARRRLAGSVVWRDRTAGVVDALPELVKTGSGGRLRVKRGALRKARAWWLTADFLARDDADRRSRGLSSRGRPPAYPRVVAAMAIDADSRSGRRSMLGLHHTARRAGVVTRTVTTGWARTAELGSTRQVEVGRTCSRDERAATGLHRRRSVYDFARVDRSPHDPSAYLGQAARVLAELLQLAEQLVDVDQAELVQAQAAADAVQARLLDAEAVLAERTAGDLLLQAEVDPVWREQAKEADGAAIAARGRANRAAAVPVDPRDRLADQRAAQAAGEDAVGRVSRAFERATRIGVFATPPVRGSGKKSSSGQMFRGLTFSARSNADLAGGQRPDGRGARNNDGASRPAPTRGGGHTGSRRPRTAYGAGHPPPGCTARPTSRQWTKSLARSLAARIEFLGRYVQDARDGRRSEREAARERGRRLACIASTLGPRLGPSWVEHPDDVVRLLERYLAQPDAVARTLIAPGDSHSPLAYLAKMLDRALAHPAVTVPWPSPVRDRYEAEVAAVAELARSAELRAAMHEQAAAAAADRQRRAAGGGPAGLAAARHAAVGGTGARDRLTQSAIPARRRPAESSCDDWAEPSVPGDGLPGGWKIGQDRDNRRGEPRPIAP